MTSPTELDDGKVQYMSHDLVDELSWFLANYNWQNLGRLRYTLNSSQAFKSTLWSKRVDKPNSSNGVNIMYNIELLLTPLFL